MKYRASGTAMARLSARPAATVSAQWPDLTAAAADGTDGWYRWLEHVWSDQQLVSAIEVAAGAQLTGRVAQALSGGRLEPARLRRLVMSVMRYVLRSGRPTPFGLFAGVAPVRFGTGTRVPKAEPLAVARVDALRVDATVRRLESVLLERLPVVANDLCARRGERLVVPVRQDAGGGAPVEVSVRLTRAVEDVLAAAARRPLPLGDLITMLGARYPQQSPEVIKAMLVTLLDKGVLLSGLRPPMTAVDPLDHVLAALEAMDAEAVPEAQRWWRSCGRPGGTSPGTTSSAAPLGSARHAWCWRPG